MTAVDHGFFTTLYVTNVLNGTLAVRTDPATGCPERTDPGALAVGPTGVALALAARCTWPTPRATGSRRSPMRRSASSRSATVG